MHRSPKHTELVRDGRAPLVVAVAASLLCGCSSGDKLAGIDAGATGNVSQAVIASTQAPQGSLRSADPALVKVGDHWASLSSSESLSAPFSKVCDPSNSSAFGGKTFAHVPFRLGPTPAQLDDCWTGDVMPSGPGAWADSNQGSVMAPTIAKFPTTYALYYSVRKSGSSQRCIGYALGPSATGPNWFQSVAPVVCPASGRDATDPELFYDAAGAQWYLLWREDLSACEAAIFVQPVDKVTGQLSGTRRQLLRGNTTALGYDQVADATCSGGKRYVLGNPTMVRGDNNELWLFFSAGDRNSTDHATGWALCGQGSPVSGTGDCAVSSVLDPNGRFRPAWGWSKRLGLAGSANPRPYFAFPNYQGLGALSVATADPTAVPAPGQRRSPLFAAAQMYWADASQLHTELVFRLDTGGGEPGLFETEPIAWHGGTDTFGSVGTVTASGQAVGQRIVSDLKWLPGTTGIFNEVTAIGTLVMPGLDHNYGFVNPTMDGMSAGAFDPKTSHWSNTKIRPIRVAVSPATLGPETLPPFIDSSGVKHNGGSTLSDVQVLDDGNAVAFTAMRGYPDGFPPAASDPSVWPVFGILTNVGGQWTVQSGNGWVNEWTGGALSRTVPRDAAHPTVPSVSERACPPSPLVPSGESRCGGPNELGMLPQSHDLVVAQYTAQHLPDIGGDTSRMTGIMVLRYTKLANGRYDVQVKAVYQLPVIHDPTTTDPADRIALAPKEIQVDRTGVLGDERFVVSFDEFRSDAQGTPVCPPSFPTPVIQEFSYNAGTNGGPAVLTAVSAPIIPGYRETPTSPLAGYANARYDRDGNLWAFGVSGLTSSVLGIYAKTSGGRKTNCGVPTDPVTHLPTSPVQMDAFTTLDSATQTRVWGQICPPDYEIVQAGVPGIGPGFANMQFTEDPDPTAHLMVGATLHTPSNLMAVRYAGSGANMTFETAVLDTGKDALPNIYKEIRPGSFDASGRFWFGVATKPADSKCSDGLPPPAVCAAPRPGVTCPVPNQDSTHWVGAVDVARAFEPHPVVLSAVSGTAARIEAENTTSHGTTRRGPLPDQPTTVLVDSRTLARRCKNPGNPGTSCPGYELSNTAGTGVDQGSFDYAVWVPVAGAYSVSFRVKGGGGAVIQLKVDGSTLVSGRSANTGGVYATVTEPAPVLLGQGMHQLTLTVPAGQGGVAIDSLTLTRN